MVNKSEDTHTLNGFSFFTRIESCLLLECKHVGCPTWTPNISNILEKKGLV